jgi:hypothetical protein
MDPNDIVLEDLNKSFEYVKACKEIDDIDDIDELKNISKAYMKLYMKQQEVLSTMFGKSKDKYL